MFEMALWTALGIGTLYLLVRLVLRQRHHEKLLQNLIEEKGWRLGANLGRALPEALADQTLSGLGDPVNDHTFNIYRAIWGQHRGRDFVLVSCKQKPIKRTEIKDETWVFTALGNTAPYPLLSIRPASKLLDTIETAERSIAASNSVALPARLQLSTKFNEKHVILGTEGTAALMTNQRQAAFLAKPDIVRREDETWYQRRFVVPGTTENYAWINFSSVDPHTLMNRLDALMDWVEIIGPEPQSQKATAKVAK